MKSTPSKSPDSSAVVAQLQDAIRTIDAVSDFYEKNKILFYKPRGEQLNFHNSVAEKGIPTRLALGSNRSGKSTAGVVEAIAHAIGKRPWLPKDHPGYIVRLPNGMPIPVPNIGRVVAQNFKTSIVQNIYPQFMEWLPKDYIAKVHFEQRQIPTCIELKCGSKIYLMSNEQDDMIFEGTKGHWALFDEPPRYAVYIAVKRGLVDYFGQCWIMMTPISEPWVADVIAAKAGDSDGNIKMFNFSVYDMMVSRGGPIPDKALNEYINNMRDDEKEARLYGNFLHLAGRVFKQWKPEPPFYVPPFDIPPHWPRLCLIDPHPRKPVAVMWLAISPDNQKIVYRDLYDEGLKTIADVARVIHTQEGWLERRKRWVMTEDTERIHMRIIDTSANQMERTSGITTMREFAKHGIRCLEANKRNKDAGLNAIHEHLKIQGDWQEPGLIVFNTCQNVKSDFMLYCYDEWRTSRDRDLKDEKQEPRKRDDDFIDLIRYALQKDITYNMLRGPTVLAARQDEDEDGFDITPETHPNISRLMDRKHRRVAGFPGMVLQHG